MDHSVSPLVEKPVGRPAAEPEPTWVVFDATPGVLAGLGREAVRNIDGAVLAER